VKKKISELTDTDFVEALREVEKLHAEAGLRLAIVRDALQRRQFGALLESPMLRKP
jgi:hypothetical protein